MGESGWFRPRSIHKTVEIFSTNVEQGCPPQSSSLDDFCLVFSEFVPTDKFNWNLLPGGTLHQYVAENPEGLPPYIAYRYLLQIMRGLSYLHDHRRIHTDLKPSNILISSDRSCLQIGDFDDCVKLNENITGSKDVTRRRGTIQYMAPEMILHGIPNNHLVGRKVDVWSLGCVIMNMISGKIPSFINTVNGEHIDCSREIMLRYFHNMDSDYAPATVPQNHPVRFKNIVDSCCMKDPNDRPSAQSLLEKEEKGMVSNFLWGCKSLAGSCLQFLLVSHTVVLDTNRSPSSLFHPKYSKVSLTYQFQLGLGRMRQSKPWRYAWHVNHVIGSLITTFN